MLWELWPATQDFWEFMVTNSAGRYGATACAFIHHADVTGKLEHTSRGRCDGAVAETQVTAAGVEHPANHGTSCEWLFRETAHDVKFWHEELDEQALLIKTRAAKIPVGADGAAPLNKAHARLVGIIIERQQPSQVSRTRRADDEGYTTGRARNFTKISKGALAMLEWRFVCVSETRPGCTSVRGVYSRGTVEIVANVLCSAGTSMSQKGKR